MNLSVISVKRLSLIAATAAMATITLPLILSAMTSPATAQEANSIISVTGTGTARAVPDMAVITIGIQRQAKTARSALNDNNKAMAAILAALKNAGIDDKDIQTSGFNIQPRYQYYKQSASGVRRPPQIVGYMVSNQLDLRIRNLAYLGKIIDKTVALGVNAGGNIRFLKDDLTPVLAKARTKAVADAISKAETLSRAAGVKLGNIVKISENSSLPGHRPVQQLAMARSPAVESVPIAAGENAYQVNVQISWQIRQ